MIDIENKPFVLCDSQQYQIKCARIAERPSFGKTVLALALICAQKTPKTIPELCSKIYKKNGNKLIPDITIRYSCLIPITVVAASSTIISQWEENTERFTSLKYFTISNVKHLVEFERLVNQGKIKEYDLVFVKVGKVSSSFKVEGEPDFTEKNRSLFVPLSYILEGRTISRLIVDDYDLLKICFDDVLLHAMFTWFISATRRNVRRKKISTVVESYDSIESLARHVFLRQCQINVAADCDILNENCSLQCDADYASKYLNTTMPSFRNIYIKGGDADRILRGLDVNNDILEMINSGAVKTASDRLSFDAKNIGDIVKCVIGNNLDEFKRITQILIVLNKLKDKWSVNNVTKKEDYDRAMKIINKKKIKAKEETLLSLKISSFDAKVILDSMIDDYETRNREHHNKLSRMKDNIREGYCQCCSLQFSEVDDPTIYVMIGCCQILICNYCATGGSVAMNLTRCPNCIKKIKDGHVMRVGKEIKIEDVIGVNLSDDIEEELEKPNEVEKTDLRLNALVDILTEKEKIDCVSDVFVTSKLADRLLFGDRDAPPPKEMKKRYMIFCMYPESENEIILKLKSINIPFAILKGTREERDKAVDDIRRGTVNVLLITSVKNCGGIHLPFLTHIIMYHYIIDDDIRAQTVARGQRVGREYNLEIITILNEAEKKIDSLVNND